MNRALGEQSYFRFLFTTVSGTISLINFVVYLAIIHQTGEYGTPSSNTLMAFGAKDPVAVAQGEWWRLFTNVFLHIGPLHLAMNSYAIRAIGQQIEQTIGPWLFVVVYLTAGFIGSVASGLFSLSLSAGASGAIMGLLGFGLVIESLVGIKLKQRSGRWPRMGAYLLNTLFITAFGVFVPNIDNAAHFGGFISGAAVGSAILFVRPNRLIPRSPLTAIFLVAVVIAVGVGGVRQISDPELVFDRLVSSGDSAAAAGEKIFYYSRALELNRTSAVVSFKRGRALLDLDEIDYAIFDLTVARKDPSLAADFDQLLETLKNSPGKAVEAYRLQRLINPTSPID